MHIRGPMVPLIERLREETRDLHEGLERELDWERRMATPEGYVRLLTRWWGFHAVFEPMVEASPPFVGLDGRGKLRLIEADLRHLGHSHSSFATLPRISDLAFLNDRAAMIGAMYVLEGSTLGGQVIARHVERHLGAGVAKGGCSYFLGYGKAATMPMWRSFQDRLTDEVDVRCHHDIVVGARHAFAVLRGWLPG